jgi:hypothetical protein
MWCSYSSADAVHQTVNGPLRPSQQRNANATNVRYIFLKKNTKPGETLRSLNGNLINVTPALEQIKKIGIHSRLRMPLSKATSLMDVADQSQNSNAESVNPEGLDVAICSTQ